MGESAVVFGFFTGIFGEGMAIFGWLRQLPKSGQWIKRNGHGLSGFAELAYLTRIRGCEIDSLQVSHLVIMIACGIAGEQRGAQKFRSRLNAAFLRNFTVK